VDARVKLMSISWPASAAAAAEGVLTSLDQALSVLKFDTGGKYFYLFVFNLDVGVADAANALRKQIGLPAIRKFSGPPL
jgi:hypothetical protein